MPYKIVKSGSKYNIINKHTGKKVGSSKTKAKAKASARIRMTAHKKKG